MGIENQGCDVNYSSYPYEILKGILEAHCLFA